MNNLPERLARVYAWCDALHWQLDPRRNAFRPQLSMNDKQISRAMKWGNKKDASEDGYSKDRIAHLQKSSKSL